MAKVLYQWRERRESVAFAMTSKNYAAEAARYAKEDYIRRNGIAAHLEYIQCMSQYRMVYEVTGNPLVSIIIPSKDHPEVLMQCVESIRNFTAYPNYEIVVVDNYCNSNPEALRRVRELTGKDFPQYDFLFDCVAGTGRWFVLHRHKYYGFLSQRA